MSPGRRAQREPRQKAQKRQTKKWCGAAAVAAVAVELRVIAATRLWRPAKRVRKAKAMTRAMRAAKARPMQARTALTPRRPMAKSR